MKTVRTPGTWVPVLNSSGQFSIGAMSAPGRWPKGRICDLVQGNEADAHLIAAAPELLEALELCLKNSEFRRASGVESGPMIEREIEGARAAIAKARGET